MKENPHVRSSVTIVVGLVAAALVPGGAGSAGDGGRIVFRTVRITNPQKPPDVYTVLPTGSGRRLLARGAEQPTWSADRRRIAFVRSIPGREGIWVMSAGGTGERRLTTKPGDGDPTWSPDGSRIAFRRSVAGGFDLWVVRSSGGNARSLRRTPLGNELAPDWSPDGRQIAFQSNNRGRFELWVLTLRTGKARRLTKGPSYSPDWAPDGRRIAYSTAAAIAVVDVRRPRPRVLPSGPPRSADFPAWSPDGSRIAFERGGQVLSMRAAGGDLHYVTRAAWGTNGQPDW
jgi:Tol biopolymer transport system component